MRNIRFVESDKVHRKAEVVVTGYQDTLCGLDFRTTINEKWPHKDYPRPYAKPTTEPVTCKMCMKIINRGE
jgi:hypothetical protein